jgi:hypothetical protein
MDWMNETEGSERTGHRGRAINDKADPKVGPSGIGTAGFEPATPATPLQCATGLRYVPSIEAEV